MDVRAWSVLGIAVAAACYRGVEAADDTTSSVAETSGGSPTSGEATSSPNATTLGSTTADPTTTTSDETEVTSEPLATTDDDGESTESTGGDDGPMVDLSDPQLYAFAFTAAEADPAATLSLGTQLALLDTRVPPRGELVVYLHGSGAPEVCGGMPMGEVLAGMGYHVLMPCYESDYGVTNCGDDVGGCRLEAFEGVDHHPFLDITPPNAIEPRVVHGLEYVQSMHPGGDWQYFVGLDTPRWNLIVIGGISHGASTSGLVGKVRSVRRAVMLSGPFDLGQAWLTEPSMTALDRFWGFTHTADEQHSGHLQAFEDMGLLGAPTTVDGVAPRYGGSHRLVTSAPTDDGHSSTQAGATSPQIDGEWVFLPVWQTMFTADP